MLRAWTASLTPHRNTSPYHQLAKNAKASPRTRVASTFVSQNVSSHFSAASFAAISRASPCSNQKILRNVHIGQSSSPHALGRELALGSAEPSLLQLALARSVLAVLPDHPLAVLRDIFGDQRHGILPVVVERDRPDDGVVVRDLAECIGDLLAIRSDLLDGVEDQLHRDEREGAVGLRRLLVAGLVVLLLEKLPARQLFDRGALDEAERALRQRSQRLDISVGLDARSALQHRAEADLVHLRSYADADRREAAEIDDLGIERLCLRELGSEILLVGRDAEGAEDLPAVLLGVFREIFVVTLAVVGGVVNDHPFLEPEAGHQYRGDLVLVDHRAVDPMHFRIF